MKFKKGSKHKITMEGTMLRSFLHGKKPKLSKMLTNFKISDAVAAVTQQRDKQK